MSGILKANAMAFLKTDTGDNIDDICLSKDIQRASNPLRLHSAQIHYEAVVCNYPQRKSLASCARQLAAEERGAMDRKRFKKRFIADGDHTCGHLMGIVSEFGSLEDVDRVRDTLKNETHYYMDLYENKCFDEAVLWTVLKSCPSMSIFLNKAGFDSYGEVLAWEASRLNDWERKKMKMNAISIKKGIDNIYY